MGEHLREQGGEISAIRTPQEMPHDANALFVRGLLGDEAHQDLILRAGHSASACMNDAAPSTGYETLIYDCMLGDATLFQRADHVEAGWRVVQPILDAWAGSKWLASPYPAGSNGPEAADDLLARDRRQWRRIE